MQISEQDSVGYSVALSQARLGVGEGGIPIGSSLFASGLLLGAGRNRRVQSGDPTAHAEIDALRNAGRRSSYAGATLYSTLAPCALCTGAAIQFGINRVVVGENVSFAGELQLLRERGIEVLVIDDTDAMNLMKKFISENPVLWNEDIGVETP